MTMKMISPTDDETPKTIAFEKLMKENVQPLVFKHATDDWPPVTWTLAYLNSLLGDKHMTCKISAIQPEEFQWESECVHVQITMQQYTNWLYNRLGDGNPLKLFDRHKFSCYIDYKYMKDMFEDHPDVLKTVSWKSFGLDDRDGSDSTIWIGSQGAYTPCHQDTYGFNLVAQIQGRKLWYLFDPSQTASMYPTRIPYEESSVYSEVNIRYPDLSQHPLFKKTTPYIVELVPGDVLYVPRHWWHFVESLEPTISINTWVPLVEDRQSRLEESISRLLFSSLASGVPTDSTLLNTGEELHETSVNVEFVRTAIQDLIKSDITCDKDTLCMQRQSQTDRHTAVHNLSKSDVTHDRDTLCKQGQSQTDRCVDDNFNSFVKKFHNEQVIISTCTNQNTSSSLLNSGARRMNHNVCDEHNSNTCASVDMPDSDCLFPCKKRKVDSWGSDGNSTSGSHGIPLPPNTDDNDQSSSHSYNSEHIGPKCLQISAVPAIQFEDFVHFLEKTFNYYTISDDEKSECFGTLDSESSALKPSSSSLLLPDILNAILEPSVISLISSVLIKKCQK